MLIGSKKKKQLVCWLL